MRNILVFQHVAHEPLGTLNPLLKKNRFRIKYVNFERDPLAQVDISKYNGLIVLGGPMGVYDTAKFPHLNYELQIIEEALKKDIPILGICLGAQLIAKALSAEVKPHNIFEAGWCELELTETAKTDSIFTNFQNKEKVFQLHGDRFDIPKTATHLAKTKACESQAFKYGEKVYGLQFHLEVDKTMIERWTKTPATKELIEKVHSENVNTVLQDTNKYISRSLDLSELSFQSFLNQFNIGQAVTLLGSDHGKPKS